MIPPAPPASAAEARYAALLAALAVEFPGFRLVDKAGDPLQGAIDRALRLLTLGGQSGYLDQYVTTLGRTVYVPAGWAARDPEERWATLRHERIHLLQFRRYGLPLMALLYLLLPLPVGLAWCRMRLERQAYAESIRATAEARGRAAVEDPAYRAHVIAQFTGPAYAWMWPFPRALSRWYDGVLSTLPG